MTGAIYELGHRAVVKLRMFDAETGRPIAWRLTIQPGLRCKLIGRKQQDYLLQPVGDPTSEITAPMGTWSRWKRVGA